MEHPAVTFNAVTDMTQRGGSEPISHLTVFQIEDRVNREVFDSRLETFMNGSPHVLNWSRVSDAGVRPDDLRGGDMVVVINFVDEASFNRYLNSEDHQAFRAAVLPECRMVLSSQVPTSTFGFVADGRDRPAWPTRRRVTIADVASLAEVDKGIVSRVLSRDPNLRIRQETRKRILQAVSDAGYRPNRLARQLRTQTPDTIGLVVPDLADPLFARIVRGAEREVHQHGMHLLAASSGDSPADSTAFMNDGRIRGLLIAGLARHPTDGLTELPAGPWLEVRSPTQATRWVVIDDYLSTRLAIEHLIGLGHKRIGYIQATYLLAGAQPLPVGSSVIEKLDVDGEVIIASSPAASIAGAAAAFSELVGISDPPTGIVVENVMHAPGVLSKAKAMGLRVPEDISVVASHDYEIAEYFDPPLTTVATPLGLLGSRGVQLLVGESDDSADIQVTLSEGIELRQRSTTGPAHVKDRTQTGARARFTRTLRD